jgi:hypothetical protein
VCIGIDGAEAFGGLKRVARIGLFEQSLALQIGRLHKISIDDSEMTDAGADEQIGGCGTDGAATDDHGARGEKAGLTVLADARKEHLARVFFQ